MLDGELQTVVGAPHEIAGGVGPGMEIGRAAQGLAEIAARERLAMWWTRTRAS